MTSAAPKEDNPAGSMKSITTEAASTSGSGDNHLSDVDTENIDLIKDSINDKVCGDEEEKEVNDKETEYDESLLQDRGWAWLVMVGCFLSHMITGGLERSDGLFFLKLRARYGESAQVTAWAGALAATVMLSMGPVSGMLTNLLSSRASVMMGSFLFSLGLICSGLAPNMPVLLLCFGIVQGLGRGLAYVPGFITVGMYFNRRRGLGMGLSTAGVGAGTFILPPLMEFLFEEYGFSGAFLILGGIALNFCLVAMLYRPLFIHRNIVFHCHRPKSDRPTRTRDETKDCSAKENDDYDRKEDMVSKSCSVNEDEPERTMQTSRVQNGLSADEKASLPLDGLRHEMKHFGIVVQIPNCQRTVNGTTYPGKDTNWVSVQPEKEFMLTEKDEAVLPDYMPTASESTDRLTKRTTNTRVISVDPANSGHNSSDTSSLSLPRKSSCGDYCHPSDPSQCSQEHETYNSNIVPETINPTTNETSFQCSLSPFFQHERHVSIRRKPPGVASPSSNTFKKHVLGPMLSAFRTCFPVERRGNRSTAGRRLLDCSLLQNPAFLFYCFSICLFTASMKSSLVFLPPLVKSNGVTEMQAAYLLSLSGVMDTVGRITMGIVLEMKQIRHYRPLVYTGFVFALSSLSFVAPFLYGVVQFGVGFALTGFCTGCYVSQKTVVVMDLLGTQRLASSIGLLTFFQGVGNFAGPPLSGIVIDVMGQYREVFFLGGGSLAVAGLLMVVSNMYSKRTACS